jgi:hypothetical protein
MQNMHDEVLQTNDSLTGCCSESMGKAQMLEHEQQDIMRQRISGGGACISAASALFLYLWSIRLGLCS